MAIGAFQPGSAPIYASLLIPATRPRAAYRVIVVYRPLGKSGVESQVLEQSDSADRGDYLIRAVKLVEVFDAQFVRRLPMKDGILVGDWTLKEYETDVYFWKDGRFRFEPIDR